ncbi:UDP-N-acetylmuramoyl-L-alanyl-D-glutamate--2,6-diaminopimelate ligase [Prochlorococcus sp. MIT 1307]|uniref:UDP-N-acetylmuramoyl-L-alanyl-D-glutamate--2, 6-diaminopimelate ligase n=1 Tax=Prochlorococcus sp. MIT 1307 TaxID=3096219 RepID=UPI002A751A26|nr:UDP-N-acetylmuramoyl-L-alanyl-D-glutamate--2,6-diaminopimelate ligase [Prochlorococcus sp. MIT 1307]
MTQNLHSLLHSVGLSIPSGMKNHVIEGITCDSRCAVAGSLFCGLPGQIVDGGQFWPQALSAGAAAAVISQEAAKLRPPGSEDSVMVLPDPVAQWVGELAAAFWQVPSSKIPLIGVTGTNGKTTVTYLIEHLTTVVGKSAAVFGTLVNRWPNHSEISVHTTAFADTLQTQLAAAVEAGAQLGAMEVSSHALAQQRVAGCRFAGAIFTNLTQDHLDYHLTMDDYFKAKESLFLPPLLTSSKAKAVVNIDDTWGALLAEQLGERCWRSSLVNGSSISSEAELIISEIEMTSRGATGLLQSPVGEGRFVSPLIGRFNLMNFLQAVGVLIQQGLPLSELLRGIASFSGVPGRMERVNTMSGEDASKLPTVIVDYAHTPDGLKNALIAARPFAMGKLTCLFGCGGDRDRGKRPQMGMIASQLADRVIITSDNPRTEDPKQIFKDILAGIPSNIEVNVEVDRSLAIRLAIDEASYDDVVLVAGKGHEDYQIIGAKKVYFDDREEANKALGRKLINNKTDFT